MCLSCTSSISICLTFVENLERCQNSVGEQIPCGPARHSFVDDPDFTQQQGASELEEPDSNCGRADQQKTAHSSARINPNQP